MSKIESKVEKEETTQDDSILDIDLIEVDELLSSASRLLEEVYSLRPSAARISTPSSPREDAMQQVQRFLESIRERDEDEDDVVFVEARPGNARPANAHTTAVVDLCTPTTDDGDSINLRSSRRRSRTANLGPIECPELNPTPNNSNNAPKSRRRRQPKSEPVDDNRNISLISEESPTSFARNTRSSDKVPLMCSVCMDSVVGRQPSSTSCGHIFCQSCIMQAIRLTKKCPLCNCKLKPSQVHRIYF